MIALFLALGLNASAQLDCSLKAETYVTHGYTQPGEYRGEDKDENLIYVVRTIDNGGDAAYEVIVTSNNCSLISKRLLWTE